MQSENPSQWTILEPLCYSSFVFATLVYGVIGYKFCWLLPQSRSTSWTRISWDTKWARISGTKGSSWGSPMAVDLLSPTLAHQVNRPKFNHKNWNTFWLLFTSSNRKRNWIPNINKATNYHFQVLSVHLKEQV